MDNTTLTATIASGTALSEIEDLGEYRLVGIRPPTAWTAAALSFSVSYDGVNFFSLRNDDATGTEFSFPTGEVSGAIVSGVGQVIIFTETNRERFRRIPYLRLRSGPVAAPVNQAAERVFTLILERKWK